MIFERCRMCSLIFQNSPRHVNSAFNPILLATGNFNSLIPRIPRSINFPGSGTKNIKRFFLCPLLRANENSQLPLRGDSVSYWYSYREERSFIKNENRPAVFRSRWLDFQTTPIVASHRLRRANEGERAAISTGNYLCTCAATWSVDRSRTTWKTENHGKERTLVIGNRPGIFTVSRSGIVSPA